MEEYREHYPHKEITEKNVGLLLNFNVPKLVDGIKRFVL